ncbi:MAG: hypothetical protein ACRDA4_01835 [Filifactoraceae bacterium]
MNIKRFIKNMERSNKIYVFVIIAIVVLAGLFANSIKKSFINIKVKDILRTSESISVFLNTDEKIDTDINTKQLHQNSEMILRVKLKNSNERMILNDSTLSKCIVQEVYKGNLNANDEIYLYENISIRSSWHEYPKPPTKIYYDITSSGYNFMKDNEEYIIFVNEIKNPIPNDKTKTYLIYDSVFGKFNTNDEVNSIPIDEDIILNGSGYNYKNVEDFDILVTDDKIIKKYKDIKDDILKKYKDIKDDILKKYN